MSLPTLPPDVNAMELDDLLRGGAHLYDEDGFECFYVDGNPSIGLPGTFVYHYYGFEAPVQPKVVQHGSLFRHDTTRYENTEWLLAPCCHGFRTVEELAIFVAFAGVEHS